MFARLWNSIQGRLTLLAVVATLALLGIGLVARNTVESVKINSEPYKRIVQLKDMLSDLTPASLNVIRAKSVVTGVDPGARPEALAAVFEDLNREKSLFQAA